MRLLVILLLLAAGASAEAPIPEFGCWTVYLKHRPAYQVCTTITYNGIIQMQASLGGMTE